MSAELGRNKICCKIQTGIVIALLTAAAVLSQIELKVLTNLWDFAHPARKIPTKTLPVPRKAMDKQHVYQFSYFQLDPAQKILLHDGHRVSLDPKTFLILLVLVEAEGHVISKGELMAKVWPDAFVEENNLTKNISRLRKALGNGDKSADLIETIPKVGYRFSAKISLALAANGSANSTIAAEAAGTREAEVKGTDSDSRQLSVRRDYNYPPRPWHPR